MLWKTKYKKEKQMKLTKIAKKLAIELCGNEDRAKELIDGHTKSEYWQGIKDAIKGLDRLTKK